MVTGLKNKQFQEGAIHLSADDIEALARTMEELGDDVLETESDPDGLIDAESRLDRELFDRFAGQMSPRSMKRDPSCVDDQELWSRIRKARSSSADGRVLALQPRNRRWKIAYGAAAAAAGLFLAVGLWESGREQGDPSLQTQFKGVNIKEGQFREKGCELALLVDGQTIRPDVTGTGVPAFQPVHFLAQCRGRGYLHMLIVSGADRIVIPNIKTPESGDFQELMDQKNNTFGVMTPDGGILQITYGLSEDLLKDEQLEQLDIEKHRDKDPSWLWMREVRWPIVGGEARP